MFDIRTVWHGVMPKSARWRLRIVAGAHGLDLAIVARIFAMRGAGLKLGKFAYQRSAEARSISVFAPAFLTSRAPEPIS